MKQGSGPDVRDGERISLPFLPAALEAYRQPDGQIAIWDPQRQRHVMIEKAGRQLVIAVQQLGYAREYDEAGGAQAAHG